MLSGSTDRDPSLPGQGVVHRPMQGYIYEWRQNP